MTRTVHFIMIRFATRQFDHQCTSIPMLVKVQTIRIPDESYIFYYHPTPPLLAIFSNPLSPPHKKSPPTNYPSPLRHTSHPQPNNSALSTSLSLPLPTLTYFTLTLHPFCNSRYQLINCWSCHGHHALDFDYSVQRCPSPSPPPTPLLSNGHFIRSPLPAASSPNLYPPM